MTPEFKEEWINSIKELSTKAPVLSVSSVTVSKKQIKNLTNLIS